MNKPILFVINPTAGSQKNFSKEQVMQILGDRQVLFQENFVTRNQDIVEHLNNGCEDFIAVGGDGTVNGLARLIMNTPARLGIIPTGSGNGLARDLGIPMDLENALQTIKSGNSKKIDVGLFNDMPFFCTAGIGFDAFAAYEFAHTTHSRGLANYLKIIVNHYMTYEPLQAILNGESCEFFSMTFSNSGQFGNNAYISPQSKIDDGILDCAILLPHPKYYGVKIGIELMTKHLAPSKYYKVISEKEYKVEEISDKKAHIDGESIVLEKNKIEVKVLEEALNVIIK